MADWAEQYNAKKAARLEEEKSKLNKNTGFRNSNDDTTHNMDVKNNQKEDMTILVVNSEGDNGVINDDEVDNDVSKSTPQSEQISCEKENEVKENLENSEDANISKAEVFDSYIMEGRKN